MELDDLSQPQNYIRPETLSRANARLVGITRHRSLWPKSEGREVASADGLRLVVPLKTGSMV
jgi:hypothetical protein